MSRTKHWLLLELYNLEYHAKINDWNKEYEVLSGLVRDLEGEVYDVWSGQCNVNCGLFKKIILGHGLVESHCLAKGCSAPLGETCNVSERDYDRIRKKLENEWWF